MLDVVFTVIKSNEIIDKLRIFEHGFLYTAYTNDTSFFEKIQISVLDILKLFENFQKFLV